MSLISSTCFQLGPSTAPGMAHCPLATARAPEKGNGGKRLSGAQPSMLELRELSPHSVIQPAFIHSLVHSFDKVIPQIHSFTSHLFLPQVLMTRGKSFKVAAEVFFSTKSFVHSFIHLTSQFLPLQIQTLGRTLTPRRTAEKTPEQLVEAPGPGRSPCPQNQQCLSPTLGIAGVSPLLPLSSPTQPLGNQVSGSLGFQQYLSHVFK